MIALTDGEIAPLSEIGYGAEDQHAGTCIIVDNEIRHVSVIDDSVEILPISAALQKYPWVQDLMFNLIAADLNELVREFARSTDERVGHFIWVHEGADVTLPLQSFTLLETPQGRQFVHNITVIDNDARVTMLSGAAVPSQVHTGHHVSISETYVRDGATCHSVSIERWGSGMDVHSYARSRIGRGAHSSNTTIALSKLRHHYSNGATVLGEDGVSNEQMVIFAPAGATRTIESEITLAGIGANAESLTRMVTAGGDIVNRSVLVGQARGVRGYLGCDGLKLTDGGQLLSSPSLVAHNSDAQLSHEASIGMISPDKIAYLLATGMTEENARALIVQGFLDFDQQQIPEALREQVQSVIAAAKTGYM